MSPGPVVAAVDCGTNSLRMLVAEVRPGGLRELERLTRAVRLGEGVDRSGGLSPGALRRARATCLEYRRIMDRHGVVTVRCVATSAIRDAGNRAEFTADVRSLLGVEPEVVSGEVEARLTYTGATGGMRFEWPTLVFDIGGGSTEFVLGDGEPRRFASVDMGCVRFTERHLTSDPPTPDEVTRLRADVRRHLDIVETNVPLSTARALVGCAGTVTAVAALALGLSRYDPARIQGAEIDADQARLIARRLAAMTTAQRSELPVMRPGRADVIAAGCLILEEILNRCGTHRLVTSERDILDGLAFSLAAT